MIMTMKIQTFLSNKLTVKFFSKESRLKCFRALTSTLQEILHEQQQQQP